MMAIGDPLARLARHRSPAMSEGAATVAVAVLLAVVLVLRQLDAAISAEVNRMLVSLAASR